MPRAIDVLVSELESDPEPAAAVQRVRVGVRAIELREQVQFETGSAVLLEESHQLLDEVARVLAAHPEIARIEIRGHTDGIGGREDNQRLSEQRAAAVRTHLIAAGVAPARLAARGFGEDAPLDDDATAAGRARNRRVELVIGGE